MKPIRYESHCKECHPLSVQIAGTTEDAQLQEAFRLFARQPAPHRAPEEVRAALRERLLNLGRQHPLGADPDNEPDRYLPGVQHLKPLARQVWRRAAPENKAETLRFTDDQLKHNERLLFDGPAGCVFCHVEKPDNPRREHHEELPTYAVSNILPRWLDHAQFSHARHRMLNCTECHAGAPGSSRAADVLLPRLKTCAACHTPAVGVRNDCVECHLYHDRRNGSETNKKRTIAQCLGKPDDWSP